MADPVSLAVMSLGATGASGVLGFMGSNTAAAGAQYSAQASSAAAQYQAAVARNNKIIADRNAEYALAAGGAQVEMQGMKTRALVGSQKAAQASSGFDVNRGTPVDVRASAEQLGRLDELTIMNAAINKSIGYRTQGMNFEAEAQFDTMKSQAALAEGEYRASAEKTKGISSLLGSASSFSDKWLGFQQKGVFA